MPTTVEIELTAADLKRVRAVTGKRDPAEAIMDLIASARPRPTAAQISRALRRSTLRESTTTDTRTPNASTARALRSQSTRGDKTFATAADAVAYAEQVIRARRRILGPIHPRPGRNQPHLRARATGAR